MSNNQQQSSSQDSSSGEQKLSPNSSSVSEGKKSAPEYPPATKRSQRTNSANFGEGKSDDDAVTF